MYVTIVEVLEFRLALCVLLGTLLNPLEKLFHVLDVKERGR